MKVLLGSKCWAINYNAAFMTGQQGRYAVNSRLTDMFVLGFEFFKIYFERKLLNKPASSSLADGSQQKHLLKKILSQVTRGLDMSPLFTDIVKVRPEAVVWSGSGDEDTWAAGIKARMYTKAYLMPSCRLNSTADSWEKMCLRCRKSPCLKYM